MKKPHYKYNHKTQKWEQCFIVVGGWGIVPAYWDKELRIKRPNLSIYSRA